MHEFDGILDGDDVAGAVGVDVPDDGCQRGRFAGSRGTRDQHQPVFVVGQILHLGRQQQVFEGGYLVGNGAQDEGELAFLSEDVHAEARHAGHHIGGVKILQGVEGVQNVLFADDEPGDVLCVRAGQRLAGGGTELFLDAEGGGHARLEVNVRCL